MGMRITKPSKIELERDRIVDIMSEVDPAEPEYGTMANNLLKISKASESTKQEIDPNVAITILANLVGIIFVLGYERFHVVSSKALGMVIRPRL